MVYACVPNPPGDGRLDGLSPQYVGRVYIRHEDEATKH